MVLRGPKLFLRTEAVVLFGVSIAVFATSGLPWWFYPLLLLVPDVFMLGYLANSTLGAWSYNIGHSTILPLLLICLGWLLASPILIGLAAIWLGHVGFDRALGYGLKYNDRFKHTHLGDLEQKPRQPSKAAK
jgi:hypothetical protein